MSRRPARRTASFKAIRKVKDAIAVKEQNINGAYDHSTHHLLEFKMLPNSLIQLRTTLQSPENLDIRDYAEKGETFEICLARIATFLSIAVDGVYDIEPLCRMLIDAIDNRHLNNGKTPHLTAGGLVNAEIHETAEEIKLIKTDTVITPEPNKLILES